MINTSPNPSRKEIVVYKDPNLTVTSRLGRLLHIDRTKGSPYGALDVDMLRDGGWWLPPAGEQAIHDLLGEYGLSKFELGPRTLVAWGIPILVLVELADRLEELLAPYRLALAPRFKIAT
jgi:hypothetical protein